MPIISIAAGKDASFEKKKKKKKLKKRHILATKYFWSLWPDCDCALIQVQLHHFQNALGKETLKTSVGTFGTVRPSSLSNTDSNHRDISHGSPDITGHNLGSEEDYKISRSAIRHFQSITGKVRVGFRWSQTTIRASFSLLSYHRDRWAVVIFKMLLRDVGWHS